MFTELSKEELRKIVDLMLLEVKKDAKDRNISIHVDDEVKDYILEKGYDKKFGARPLRRTIQRLIEDELAERFLKGEILEGTSVHIKYEDGQIQFTCQK